MAKPKDDGSSKSNNKDTSSAAKFRAMEERLMGHGNEKMTWVPIAVRNLDAKGKPIFQRPDSEVSKILTESPWSNRDYALMDGQLHVRIPDALFEKAGLSNERAYVNPKPEGGYTVAPGKVVYVWDDVIPNPNQLKPLHHGAKPLLSSKNLQVVKDVKVVDKTKIYDIPNNEQYGQKDFVLKTEPNMPKTKDAQEAYRRSAKRQIDKWDKFKAELEWLRSQLTTPKKQF